MMTRTSLFAGGLVLAATLSIPSRPALADTGSANCALITQAAAAGAAARIAADDRDIQAPQSIVSLTCLDGFFNGTGLNVITSLLDPNAVLDAVKGQICNAVKTSWDRATGSVQCGLTLSGYDLGFGGLGGGNLCPKLSFGGGGPSWGNFGLGSASSGGVLVNGASVGPTNYELPPNAGAY